MSQQCCSCGCGCADSKGSLAELPVGTKATIVGISPKSRGRKKFADVGIVPGTELLIEAHAPFGGLIRVKVMETSVALHKDDAACIILEKTEDADNE